MPTKPQIIESNAHGFIRCMDVGHYEVFRNTTCTAERVATFHYRDDPPRAARRAHERLMAFDGSTTVWIGTHPDPHDRQRMRVDSLAWTLAVQNRPAPFTLIDRDSGKEHALRWVSCSLPGCLCAIDFADKGQDETEKERSSDM